MKILIYGFGRMGLTHYTILNSLMDDLQFYIVEPNKILRAILKKNINAKFFTNDTSFSNPFDISLITTPPSLHLPLLKKCIQREDRVVFVEKPFGGFTNCDFKINKSQNIFIGYVLRFNPCICWVKENIDSSEIASIHGQYLSNTIEKKPKGWRNGSFSGVLNEMGSHIIDLTHYILNVNNMELLFSKKESIISDVDDIVEAKFKTKKNVNVSFYFNWVKKGIRKPVFLIEILLKNGIKYLIDQQQIKTYDQKNNLVKKISVMELSYEVPFYLRGVDFTAQMLDLTTHKKEIATVFDALNVNKTMNKILKNEDNIR